MAFVGGDARQLEVIKKCIEMDATITLIGFDNLESKFVGVHQKDLEPDIFLNVDAVILPIVGTDEEGNVESIFSQKNWFLQRNIYQNFPKKLKFIQVWPNLT